MFAGLVSAWTLWMYGQHRQQQRKDEEGEDDREDGDGEEGTRNLVGTYTTGECSYGLARVVERPDDGGKKEVEDAKEQDNNEAVKEDAEEDVKENNEEDVKENNEEDVKENNEEDVDDFEQEAENIETPDVLYWDGEQYTTKDEEEKKNE